MIRREAAGIIRKAELRAKKLLRPGATFSFT